jgi:putative oxidoreductase
MNIGAFLLRLTIGLTLAVHGSQKLFGWFNGPGLNRTGQFFETLGFHPGRRHALLAGLAETGGGVLLALGLFTPFGSAANHQRDAGCRLYRPHPEGFLRAQRRI